MKKQLILIMVVPLVVLGLRSTATAQPEAGILKDSYPREVTNRPLTLPTDMFELAGTTLQMNVSEDLVGTPILVAPTISFGLNDDLTIGVAHSRGLCMNGETDVSGADVDLCGDRVYDDVGLRGLYSVRRDGALDLAAATGLTAGSMDPLALSLDLGLLARYRIGKLAVTGQPGVAFALTARDEGNEESVRVPVVVTWQVNPGSTPFVSTGLSTPIDEASDRWTVPLGVGYAYALNRNMDLGAEMSFPAIAGGDELTEGTSRTDKRVVALRFAWRN